jgi:hypothetical protein
MPTAKPTRQSQLFTSLCPRLCHSRMVFSAYCDHDIPFRWDEHAQTTFDDLKSSLSNAPLISPPDYDRDYILYLSASTVSVAGVLVQLGDDGHEHVIYYISKNLSGPPLKYNHDEKLLSSCPRSPKAVTLYPASNYQGHSRFQPHAVLS